MSKDYMDTHPQALDILDITAIQPQSESVRHLG